jgi:pyruvate/2-oxoglutarate dehydrogenase complex dihydrolipoamide dehydrogenase (E3) component
MMLVQSASHEGRIAAENAVLEGDLSSQHRIVPRGSYTDPEYASVGLTEFQARQAEECAVAFVPYYELDRAVIDGRTEGFFRLIVSRSTRQILGAHVVGEQAVDVIQIVAVAMAARMPVEALASVELAYPTLAEVIGLAARQVVRELGLTSLVTEWRTLRGRRSAEWESPSA